MLYDDTGPSGRIHFKVPPQCCHSDCPVELGNSVNNISVSISGFDFTGGDVLIILIIYSTHSAS